MDVAVLPVFKEPRPFLPFRQDFLPAGRGRKNTNSIVFVQDLPQLFSGSPFPFPDGKQLLCHTGDAKILHASGFFQYCTRKRRTAGAVQPTVLALQRVNSKFAPSLRP
ncbi:MAG: hypothetical protein KatS3mg038_0087 [Candidatus Kapaibacterium sp.]|nr:MAG: hypothetical protein KatS3mg038_0087 [Candidatus Kapabacteria bacterium]GIV56788.1 MAG: hypothetical protein KatS3mg040_1556 [Candidatus Kapabacteria bacterium]